MMQVNLLKFFVIVMFFSNFALASDTSNSLPKSISAKDAKDLNVIVKIAGMKDVKSCTSNRAANNVTVLLKSGKEVIIPVVSE